MNKWHDPGKIRSLVFVQNIQNITRTERDFNWSQSVSSRQVKALELKFEQSVVCSIVIFIFVMFNKLTKL